MAYLYLKILPPGIKLHIRITCIYQLINEKDKHKSADGGLA